MKPTWAEKISECDEPEQLRACADVYRKRYAKYGDAADLRRAERYKADADAIDSKFGRMVLRTA